MSRHYLDGCSSPQSSRSSLGTLPNISENYQHEFDVQTFSSIGVDGSEEQDFYTKSSSSQNASQLTTRRENSPMRQTLKPNNSLHSQTPNVVPYTTVKDWQPKSVTYYGTASLTSYKQGEHVGTQNHVHLVENSLKLQHQDSLESSSSFSRDVSPLKMSPTSNICGVERNQSYDAGDGPLIVENTRDGQWSPLHVPERRAYLLTTFIPLLRAGPVHIVRGHTQSLPSTGIRTSPVKSEAEKVIIKEVIKEVHVPVEVRKEVLVPVEVIKRVEVVKEVPVIKEVVREVPVEKIVIKETVRIVEVPVEVQTTVIRENMVEVEKTVIKEVPVERERERAVPSPPPPPPSPPSPPPRLSSPPRAASRQFTGLGMRLERRDGATVTTVEEVIPGFAAGMSGLIQPGDVLEGVEGASILGWSLQQIKDQTVGLLGSTCAVRLRRGARSFDVLLRRAVPVTAAARGGEGGGGTATLRATEAYQSQVDMYVSRSPLAKGEVGQA